jgi:hypothetical protein
MTESSPAVTAAHPPAALLKLANPALHLFLKTPVLGGLGKGFMVLTFTGRKSGRRYSVPVSAHRIDGDLYALAGAAWRLNFRGGANADVVHGGKTTTMRGELIEEPGAVADLAKRSAESYGAKTAQRMMGLKFRDNRIPTVEEFEAAARAEHLGAIRLTAT